MANTKIQVNPLVLMLRKKKVKFLSPMGVPRAQVMVMDYGVGCLVLFDYIGDGNE